MHISCALAPWLSEHRLFVKNKLKQKVVKHEAIPKQARREWGILFPNLWLGGKGEGQLLGSNSQPSFIE
jgi:hypothetical protein